MRTTHHDRHRCAQNADHLTHNRPFSAFFAEVVCTLGTIPPQTVISPSPNGGNGVIRGTTRRRHAANQLLMLQNPHRRREGIRATGVPPDAGPDCGTCARRSRPRCRWAAAGPGRASTQRTEPHVSRPGAAGVEGAGGTCRGAGGRRRGLAGLRADTQAHVSTPGTTGVEGAGGTCRGAGGRRRGLAGLRGDAPSEARSADVSRAGRRPPAHTAAGASGARNTRGATQQHHNKHPQRNEAATGCPATASSRSRSAVHNSATSNQAVMST